MRSQAAVGLFAAHVFRRIQRVRKHTMIFRSKYSQRKRIGVSSEGREDMRSMIARFERAAATACVAIGLALTGCQDQKAAPALPPPDVVVTPVVQKDVPIYNEWVATLDGFDNAQIQ